MIKTNGFRVLAMVMTTLWMVTIIPVTVVQAADFRGQGFDLSSYNGTVNWGTGCRSRHGFCNDPYRRGPGTGC